MGNNTQLDLEKGLILLGTMGSWKKGLQVIDAWSDADEATLIEIMLLLLPSRERVEQLREGLLPISTQ